MSRQVLGWFQTTYRNMFMRILINTWFNLWTKNFQCQSKLWFGLIGSVLTSHTIFPTSAMSKHIDTVQLYTIDGIIFKYALHFNIIIGRAVVYFRWISPAVGYHVSYASHGYNARAPWFTIGPTSFPKNKFQSTQ